MRAAGATTGLGADNRAGATAILCAALEILERKLPHPPVTFCWFVQEETGMHGARLVSKTLLGAPRLAFNWDGWSPVRLSVGATGGSRIGIEVQGIASHAGGAPHMGVSAIAIAGRAIADLDRNGWHGSIEKGRRRGTSNIGALGWQHVPNPLLVLHPIEGKKAWPREVMIYRFSERDWPEGPIDLDGKPF